MHPTGLEHEEPILLMPGFLVAALSMVAWVSRKGFSYARPFGISESESLMHLSNTGTLQCDCEPTDAGAEINDRRRSCRACGCAIISNDPARLYEELSPSEINGITARLRRQGIDFAKTAARTPAKSFDETYAKNHIH